MMMLNKMISRVLLSAVLAYSGFVFAQDAAPAAQIAQIEMAEFTNESELGLILTAGNAETFSFNAAQKNTYTFDQANTFAFEGRFYRTEAGMVEQSRYWRLAIRYERAINPEVSGFLSETVEADPFAGVNQRYSTDAGAKWNLFKREDWAWFLEGGYRFQVENRFVNQQQVEFHFARIYSEYSRALSETVSMKHWVEFLPNLSESQNTQINTELSLSVVLSKILQLKTGYLARYRGLPAPGTTKKLDSIFSTALVAKF